VPTTLATTVVHVNTEATQLVDIELKLVILIVAGATSIDSAAAALICSYGRLIAAILRLIT